MRRKTPTVVVGDLVHSRQVKDRTEAANRIDNALSVIAEDLQAETTEPVFAAPPKLLKGIDEMAAVLWEPDRSFWLCLHINLAIAPERFRFAIVRDGVDVGLDSGDASKMDGRAFHLAADGIETARSNDETFNFRCARDRGADELLTALANITQSLFDNLTNHQRRVLVFYGALGTQKKVAETMGISQQAVSDALRSANHRDINLGLKVIDNYLSNHAV